ncbi:glycosyltransferase family 2 protein [Pontibacter pamirensis]|uniref:glycosyltransferase family 2 protein n=1 Tax=Pontibacter pamirensis TaxID=2562824 RepID=UPI001389D2C9|nr:glycosyltransferase [Pontibacter pamirensis]
MTKLSLGVCILFFEKLDQTIECIESFYSEHCNLYILNNGSQALAFEKLKSKFSHIKNIIFFHSDENLGCPGGRSFLIKSTNEDWLVFPDSDITVDPANWIDILQREIGDKPAIEVFIPRLFNVHENSFAALKKLELIESNIVESIPLAGENINWFPGGASFIRRSLFDEVGVYDPKLFCFEDYEMGIRMLVKKRPIRMSFIEDIKFIHDHKYQKTTRDKKAVLERYNSKRLADSLEYLSHKYSVFFDHNWQYWTNAQVNLMTKSKKRKFVERILAKLIKTLKYAKA